jgi:hypothetical protein
MSPSQWGPPTWMFLHTLAENVKEESFPIIGPQIIANIIQICNFLPCPECADHAKKFWSNVGTNNLKSKSDLITLLFVFHNTVNKRKKLPAFRYDNLQYYGTKSVIESFNWFAKNFNTKGNMSLLTDSFHRSRLLTGLRQWFLSNMHHFHL